MIALDLFCGAGAASMGMWRSGRFDAIVGVDIEPQPDYPFDFMEGDALEVGEVASFDFVWASPPCQLYTQARELNAAQNHMTRDEWAASHVDLIEPTRRRLASHPWTCIENVAGAPLRPDIVLEGGNVGIRNLKRRRLFEVSWTTLSPPPFSLGKSLLQGFGAGGIYRRIQDRRLALGLPPRDEVNAMREAFDVDWVSDRQSLNQMIPPAYATYIIEDARRHGFGR